MVQKRRLVSRMLAVGDSSVDRIERLTRGESYVCCYGSEQEHRSLCEFCTNLQELLSSMGGELTDFSPEELTEFLQNHLVGDFGE